MSDQKFCDWCDCEILEAPIYDGGRQYCSDDCVAEANSEIDTENGE